MDTQTSHLQKQYAKSTVDTSKVSRFGSKLHVF